MNSEEFGILPPEYSALSPEITAPPPEYSMDVFEMPAAQKKTGLSAKVKAYILSAAVSVTAVAGAAVRAETKKLETVPRVTVTERMKEHELAFFAYGGESAERMAEQELWCSIFGGIPEENIKPEFRGVFRTRDELERAFKLDTVYHTEEGGILDLPYYEYALELPDKYGGTVQGRVYILERDDVVVARLTFAGRYYYYLIDPAETELHAPYDVSTLNDGSKTARVKVFGNGAKVSYQLKKNDPEQSVIVQVTSRGTGNAGHIPVALVLTVINENQTSQ